MKTLLLNSIMLGFAVSLVFPGIGSADIPQKEHILLPINTRSVKGELTKKDRYDAVRTKSHRKVYILRMYEGIRYVIEMRAPFDTFLRLENPKGKQLAFDDDAGGGLNSRIVFAPSHNANYRIIATSFGANVTGPFVLVIKRFKDF